MKSKKLVSVLVGFALACSFAISFSMQAQRTVKHPSLDDLSAEGRLAVFEDSLKYPPESKPIDQTYWDLLHPWQVDTEFQLMLPKAAATQMVSLEKSGLSQEEAWNQVSAQLPANLPTYRFEMNKTILAGTQDELQARLIINQTQSSGATAGTHVLKAELTGSDEFGSPELGAVPYTCVTKDSGCTFAWHAPSADKQYWGSLRLEVTVAVDGFADPFTVSQSFYSSPMVAGKFTGNFVDRIDNGSLVVDAGVDVERKMVCFVSANLYSADKSTPLQHAERRILVTPSMKTISFTFYGKIFRDYGDQGTFRLQDLKAQCENVPYPAEWFMDDSAHQAELKAFQSKPQPAREPSQIYFEHNTYSYATGSYPLSGFTNAEWQSPGKTRILEMYRKAAAAAADPALVQSKQQLQQQLGIQ